MGMKLYLTVPCFCTDLNHSPPFPFCNLFLCIYTVEWLEWLNHNIVPCNSCICNGSSLVRAVTNYGIQYGRHNSLLGHNLLFCTKLYNGSAQNIVSGSVRLVNNCLSKLFKDYQLQTASFVRERVLIREGTLELPNLVSLSRFELDQLAHVISTS